MRSRFATQVVACIGVCSGYVWSDSVMHRACAAQVEATSGDMAPANRVPSTTDNQAPTTPNVLRSAVSEVDLRVQPKLAKIYGSGGLAGLEGYQSGVLISSQGHVLTVWSTVLDAGVSVVLQDGRRLEAELLGADLTLEIALLKLDAETPEYFELQTEPATLPGTRVLAFSNLFNVATGTESCSVQRGVVAAKTNLAARRGTFNTPYRGPILVLDAVTNNPGAAGGVVVDYQGRLLGLLGKELRSATTNIWLNYALPVSALQEPVKKLMSGESSLLAARPVGDAARGGITTQALGVVLVPDVLDKTPPFVDAILNDSPAAAVGIRADDLILYVNEALTPSCYRVREELQRLDELTPVRLTVLRQAEILEFRLLATPKSNGAASPAATGTVQ